MLSGLCALDVAIDRVLNGQYDNDLGKVWNKRTAPGDSLLEFSPELMQRGRYVYYKDNSQWRMAQCVQDYESVLHTAQLTFSSNNSDTRTVVINAKNCKICDSIDILPPELMKSPKEAILSRRAPNTFLHSYKTVLTGTTFMDIKRFFRNNPDDLMLSNVRWRVYFKRAIPNIIFKSIGGYHEITSDQIEGRTGQMFEEDTRPSHPGGRDMKFKAKLECSQLHLNIYIVLHHWACFDSEKPDADDAVALGSECGNGSDRSLAAVDVDPDIMPEMFTVQRCIFDWLNALVASKIDRYNCFEDRCTVAPPNFDKCIESILFELRMEIPRIFIMLEHPLNPVFTGTDPRVGAGQINVRRARSETIVLKALMACFGVRYATKENIYHLAAESLQNHLASFLGQAVLVRCDELRCRDFTFDSFYDDNISLLGDLKLGDIFSYARIQETFELINMKLFSDLQKGDWIVLKHPGDRWMLVEFKRFEINTDPLHDVPPRDDQYEHSPRIFAIQTRRAVVFDGKAEIMIRNMESIFILRSKKWTAEKCLSWKNKFNTNFIRYTAGLREYLDIVKYEQKDVRQLIKYLEFSLYVLIQYWLRNTPRLESDLKLSPDIKQKLDQLVFTWVMIVTGVCLSEPIKYLLNSWTYLQGPVIMQIRNQVIHSKDRPLTELWKRCSDSELQYIQENGEKVSMQSIFEKEIDDAFDFISGWKNCLETPQKIYNTALPWKVCRRTMNHLAPAEFLCLRNLVGQTIENILPLETHPSLQFLRIVTRIDVGPGDILLVQVEDGFLVGSFLRFEFDITSGDFLQDSFRGDQTNDKDMAKHNHNIMLRQLNQLTNADTVKLIYSIGTEANGTPIERSISDLRKVYYITECDNDPSDQ